MRLYPPVTLLMRSNKVTQSLLSINSSGDHFTLPAPCSVQINTMALHTLPSHWGPDALEFNPARWLRQGSEGEPALVLVTPPRGTYIPWSMGPRKCPGQKMSQVEFVAVIATLFSRCTAEAMPRRGQSMEHAKRYLLELMQNSQPVLTLQMKNPKDVHIKWVKRWPCGNSVIRLRHRHAVGAHVHRDCHVA